MSTSTLTSKGQITLPVSLRKRLGLKTGDKVTFQENEDGAVLRKERAGNIVGIAARLGIKPSKPMSKADQEAMICKLAYEEYMRKVREGRA